MSGEQIPRGGIAVIDSSVLFAMGGPSNSKYQAFERFVTRRDIEVRIPDQVAEELGEGPDAYAYQRDRLQAAQNAGWLERGVVDFSNPDVSDVVDRLVRTVSEPIRAVFEHVAFDYACFFDSAHSYL